MQDIQPSSLSDILAPEFLRREATKVVVGGVTTGIGGMTIGSLLAVQKNMPATLPALSMCMKTTTFGTAFFGLRQFVVNPILQMNMVPTARTTSNKHLSGTLSTSISAAIVGGSVNAYFRGRKVASRSGFTTALVCCSIQVVYNELGLVKDYCLNLTSPANTTTSDSKDSATSNQIDSPPWWERYIPLTKITDQEWKDRLNSQLSEIDAKQKFVDLQISKVTKAMSNHPDGPLSNET